MILVTTVSLDLRVSRVLTVNQFKALLDPEAQRVNKVLRVLLEQISLQQRKDLQAHRDLRVPVDRRVNKVCLVLKVVQDLEVLLDLLVMKDPQVDRVSLVLLSVHIHSYAPFQFFMVLISLFSLSGSEGTEGSVWTPSWRA